MSAKSTLKNQQRGPVEFTIRLAAPLLWAGIILWLSLTPSPPDMPGVLGWDKLLHAGSYGLLTLLIAQFLLHSSPNSGGSCWKAGLVAVVYGALLEVLQLLTMMGRTAEWTDLIADAVGACFAGLIVRHLLGPGSSRLDLPQKVTNPRK